MADTTPKLFRAYLMQYTGSPGADITGIGTTDIAITFDWWENGDDTVFEPRKTPDSAAPVLSTDLIKIVRLKKAGHYQMTMGMYLTGGAVTDWKIALNDESVNSDPFGFQEGNHGGSTEGYNTVGFLVRSQGKVYPQPKFEHDPPDTFMPNFAAGQFVPAYLTAGCRTSSGTRTIGYAFWYILFTPLTALATFVAVPAGTQPNWAEPPAQGIAFSFQTDTHAQPIWERVDV